MLNYFSMMMAISSIFLTLDGSKEALAKRRQLWDDLKAHDGHLYRRCRFSVAEGCNLPGWLGSKISIGGYRIAQKLFKLIKEVLCVITMLFCLIWTARSPTPRRAF